MTLQQRLPQAYLDLATHLQASLDKDPVGTINAVRAIKAGKSIRGISVDALRAGILIDAGQVARDRDAVAEGVNLLKRFLAKKQDRTDMIYNLGNGLIALAELDATPRPDWFLATAGIRQEARRYFQKTTEVRDPDYPTSQAFTNLGKALNGAFRWVEAYDAYSSALDADPTNAVASLNAFRILLGSIRNGLGNRKTLLVVSNRHLENAHRHADRLRELAGEQAYAYLMRLSRNHLKGGRMPDLAGASDYERFVAKHRLMLSPTIEGLDVSLKRWDSLGIASISVPAKSGHGVPPVFGMFNVMKSDFLLARSLAFQAIHQPLSESGKYADTLDYATYGIRASMLTVAQRVCMDILDKVASATTEYFEITDKREFVYFHNRWYAKQKAETDPLRWHGHLLPHIARGNTAIIALAELARDFRQDGFLVDKRRFRHAATHRFLILHDLGLNSIRNSGIVEHAGLDGFRGHLIDSLRIARAALIYFVEMVAISEREKARRPGIAMPMQVPDHHWIRGDRKS